MNDLEEEGLVLGLLFVQNVHFLLTFLQECFPSKIHAVYIIKPEGFWERHKASSAVESSILR